jgi:hypothetical protein
MGRTKQLAGAGQVLTRLRQQLHGLEEAFATAGLAQRTPPQRARGRDARASARNANAKRRTKAKSKPTKKTTK